mmetsp:Transcript_27669/g.89374  ORF Transcript_27669/g.89374 Transcript_27669/m.89374 type:complete len:200 (-) Transcript_27669:414-1013(-)
MSYSAIASWNRSIEKAFMSISLSIGTRDCWHSMSSAKALMECSRDLTSSSSALLTKSILFRRIRSANATCCTASLTVPSGRTSLMCVVIFLASTSEMTPSIRKLLLIAQFWVKVLMMGAGSARPVVSSRTRSKSSFRSLSLVRARTKSPRTVQQAHPLSIEMTSSASDMFSLTSASSILTAPNSFSMTQIFFPCCSRRM